MTYDKLMSTTAMVPQLQQWWQADAAAEAQQAEQAQTGGGGDQQQQEPTVVEPPEPELSMDEIFNRTFSELSNEGPVVEDHTETVDQPEATVDGALPDPATVARGEHRQQTQQREQPQQPQQQPQPNDKPIEQVLRELLGERKEAPKPTAEEPRADPYRVPDYTAEQKAIVEAYESEFPEMARAEQIIRSREYNALTGYVFKQVEPVIAGQAERIKQLESVIGQMLGQQQTQQVESTIGEPIKDIKPKVEAWIETQPEFIRPAYKAIAEKGTAAEVIGLVQAYKASLGQQTQGQTQGRTQGRVITSIPVVPVTTKPKVPAGLRPVSSQRTAPTESGIARDDFEGAFTAFSKAVATS